MRDSSLMQYEYNSSATIFLRTSDTVFALCYIQVLDKAGEDHDLASKAMMRGRERKEMWNKAIKGHMGKKARER